MRLVHGAHQAKLDKSLNNDKNNWVFKGSLENKVLDKQ